MTKYEMRKAIIEHADSLEKNYDLMTLRNSIRDICEESYSDAEFRDKCRCDIMDMVNETDNDIMLAEMLDLCK